jgi:hypothetical protein
MLVDTGILCLIVPLESSREIDRRGSSSAVIVLQQVLDEVDGGIDVPHGRRDQFRRKFVGDLIPVQS